MKGQKRIRDYCVIIGELKPGEKNAITDVKGVKVGHVTLNNGSVKTGVTAILPHEGNIFKDKVIASSHVINGFGKTIGTIQIEELGTIETPIILTNTLSVGLATDALIEYMLKENEDIGFTTGTVNPVVCECNDGYLNDIRGRYVKKEHVFEAIQNADVEFEEGAVGAGAGMSCYGLKGGIGSSSRQIELDNRTYTVGILVLSNFGRKEDLTINGIRIGKMISEKNKVKCNESDKGSIIVILATDIPMTSRQLKRISRRAVIGLNRTGSYMGNGSGEIVIGFTTSNRISHYEKEATTNIKMFNENKIDVVFRAVAEATEEAILNSLICADTTEGRDGHIRYSLKEYIGLIL
ncbi:D-aminopeptidase [Caloranaerobacter azorensis DSM 13643]|uniref:D-aminopeptidase n=1 Tax=Caloranaerobacter azorensis DSM 13643 TaxID=1121264 RepID=A0A1M5R1E1_9FIRM|nr:P1 family peptidase [Caloranaerobacter azorensis]SHH19926.1 D-aminopeptidase [Caloranaerobacter azorensis DSM 13643]